MTHAKQTSAARRGPAGGVARTLEGNRGVERGARVPCGGACASGRQGTICACSAPPPTRPAFRPRSRTHIPAGQGHTMPRTRRVNRYCIDCGARMTYHPRLSSPNVPNEYRVMVYACPDCTKKSGRPKIFAIRRRHAADPLATLEKEVEGERGRKRGRPGAPRRSGEAAVRVGGTGAAG